MPAIGRGPGFRVRGGENDVLRVYKLYLSDVALKFVSSGSRDDLDPMLARVRRMVEDTGLPTRPNMIEERGNRTERCPCRYRYRLPGFSVVYRALYNTL